MFNLSGSGFMSLQSPVTIVYVLIGIILLVLLTGEHIIYAYRKWSMKRAIKLRDARDRARRENSNMRSSA
jgi:hypothetical protein